MRTIQLPLSGLCLLNRDDEVEVPISDTGYDQLPVRSCSREEVSSRASAASRVFAPTSSGPVRGRYETRAAAGGQEGLTIRLIDLMIFDLPIARDRFMWREGVPSLVLPPQVHS